MIYPINRWEGRNCMIILVDSNKKAFEKVLQTFLMESFNRLGIGEKFLDYYERPFRSPGGGGTNL